MGQIDDMQLTLPGTAAPVETDSLGSGTVQMAGHSYFCGFCVTCHRVHTWDDSMCPIVMDAAIRAADAALGETPGEERSDGTT